MKDQQTLAKSLSRCHYALFSRLTELLNPVLQLHGAAFTMQLLMPNQNKRAFTFKRFRSLACLMHGKSAFQIIGNTAVESIMTITYQVYPPTVTTFVAHNIIEMCVAVIFLILLPLSAAASLRFQGCPACRYLHLMRWNE